MKSVYKFVPVLQLVFLLLPSSPKYAITLAISLQLLFLPVDEDVPMGCVGANVFEVGFVVYLVGFQRPILQAYLPIRY